MYNINYVLCGRKDKSETPLVHCNKTIQNFNIPAPYMVQHLKELTGNNLISISDVSKKKVFQLGIRRCCQFGCY